MNKLVSLRQNLPKGLHLFLDYATLAIGCIIAAGAIQIFLLPNNLIDGGTVGLAMILSQIVGPEYLPIFIVFLTLPFIALAYRFIGKAFVLRMSLALLSFSISNQILHEIIPKFTGDVLEVVVFGGLMLGAGCGLILRHGASIDGTEITAILINRFKGYTVGQVILFCNIFIFALAGLVYQDWTTALRSLMVYMVAYKVIDAVILGFDEMKSLMIISKKPDEITQAILHQLKGVGVTVMYGRGGYSGEAREILYVIVERLQLMELKKLVQTIDPQALIAIDNLHEIVSPERALE